MSWQSEGACAGMPVNVWFEPIRSYESRARFVCSLCPPPVAVRCIREAIANGDRGIRGGLTYKERAHLHKRPLVHGRAA